MPRVYCDRIDCAHEKSGDCKTSAVSFTWHELPTGHIVAQCRGFVKIGTYSPATLWETDD